MNTVFFSLRSERSQPLDQGASHGCGMKKKNGVGTYLAGWTFGLAILSSLLTPIPAQAQFPPPGNMGPPYGGRPVGGLPQPALVPQASAVPHVSTHQRIVQLATEHPVCVIIGEGIASQYVGTQTVDEGPFQDSLMGAQLQGVQKTRARTFIDFTPDAAAAKMLYVLKGVTANDTLAQLPRASVRSAGTFHFEMTKQIEFNGESIRTWSPSAYMKVKQDNIGASTTMNNVPLLGPLANNIVLNVADQRKPISEGIAAHRVTQQVAPKFNSQLDAALAKLNQQLQGPVKDRMSSAGMLPTRVSTLTTNDAMLCGLEFLSDLGDAGGIGSDQPLRQVSRRNRARTLLVTRQLVPGPGPLYGGDARMQAPIPYSLDSQTLSDRACVLVHASLIENLAERFQLAGKEFHDTQLGNLFGGTAASGGASGPQMYTVVLDRELPLSAEVDNGRMMVEVRMSIRPIIGPEIPTQVVKISVEPKLSSSEILFDTELVSVEPLQSNSTKSTSTNPASTLIRQAIEQKLQDIPVQRQYEVIRQHDGQPFAIRLQNLTLVDGWITATFEHPASPRSAGVDPDFVIE